MGSDDKPIMVPPDDNEPRVT